MTSAVRRDLRADAEELLRAVEELALMQEPYDARGTVDFDPCAVGNSCRGMRNCNDRGNSEPTPCDRRVGQHAAALDHHAFRREHEEQPSRLGLSRDKDAIVPKLGRPVRIDDDPGYALDFAGARAEAPERITIGFHGCFSEQRVLADRSKRCELHRRVLTAVACAFPAAQVGKRLEILSYSCPVDI